MADDAFSALLQAFALQEAQKAAIDRASPYAGLSAVSGDINNAILGAASSPKYSTSEKLLAGFLGGLVGGGVDFLEDDWEARAKNEYRDALLGGFRGESVERDLLPRSVFDTAEDQGQLLRLKSIWDADQLEKAAARELESYGNKKKIDLIADREKLLFEKPWMREMQPGIRADESTDAIATQVPAGGEMDDRARVMEGLRRGEFASPADGYKFLREQREGTESKLLDQYKDIGEASARGSQLVDLANGLQSALERTGNTGLTAPVGQFADRVLGSVFEGPAKKAAAGEELESYKAEIIRLARPSGVGAMSDPEMRIYIQSGPSLSKSEEANQAIVDRLKYAGEIDQLYTLFMQESMKEGVPRPEAEAKWTRVRAENPYLVRNQNGELQQNPFWKSAMNELLGAPAQATAATAATQPTKLDYQAEARRRGLIQ